MAVISLDEWKKTTTPAVAAPASSPSASSGSVPSFSQWKGGSYIPSAPAATDKISPIQADTPFKTLFPGTSVALDEFKADPFSVKGTDPFKIFKDYWNGIKSSVEGAADAWSDVFTTDKGNAAAQTGDVASGLARTVGAVISPITSLFGAAEDIPVAGAAVKLFNGAFTVLGDVGKDIAYPVVNSIPGLSQQQRADIVDGVGEIFSLGLQIAAGKAGESIGSRYLPSEKRATAFRESLVTKYPELDIKDVKKIGSSKINQLVKRFGETDAGTIIRKAIEQSKKKTFTKEVPVTSETGETKVPVSTPLTREAAYAKSQGYEPIPTDLPTIDFGPKPKAPKSDLPVIQMNPRAPRAVEGDFTYEPIKTPEQIVAEAKAKVTAPRIPTEAEAKVAASKAKLPRIKPTVEKVAVEKPAKIEVESTPGTSKVAKRVEADAIEAGITKGFSELAGYDPITIKEQAGKAADLIARDIEAAKRQALGKEPVEAGLKPEALVVAMKEWLKKNPDAEFALEFAKSPLLSETSAHAQALRLLREQDPNSAVSKIKEVQEARKEVAERRIKGKSIKEAKEKIVKDIQKEIKKTRPTKQNWEEFIKSIEC